MMKSVDVRHAMELQRVCTFRRHGWFVFAFGIIIFSIPFGEFQRALLGGATVSKIIIPLMFLILLGTDAYRLKIHPHLWMLLLFIIGTLPSLIIGNGFEVVFFSLIGYIVLFEILCNVLVSADDLRFICISYVSGLFIVAMATMMAALGFDFGLLIGHPLVEIWYGIPVFRGTEQNPNGFATFFVPGCVIAGYLYFSASNRLSSLLLMALLVFFGIILIMTGSRSGLFGAFLGLMIVYLNRRIFTVHGAISFAVIIVSLLIIISGMPKVMQFILLGDVDLSNSQSVAADKETSTALRAAAMSHFFDAFSSNPLIGIGYGNLAPYIEASPVGEKMGAHNMIIGVAVEMGVIALLPFLIMIVVSVTCMANALKGARVRDDALIKGCYFGAFIGLLFHGMFHEIYVSILFWFYMGIGSRLNRLYENTCPSVKSNVNQYVESQMRLP